MTKVPMTVDDHVPDLVGPHLLRDGREADDRIDLPVGGQEAGGIGDRRCHEADVIVWIDAHEGGDRDVESSDCSRARGRPLFGPSGL